MQRLERDQLEQDRAERVDVRARSDPAGVDDLLGCHVARRAEQRVGARHVVRATGRAALDMLAGRLRTRAPDRRELLGEPPVEHVDLAVLAEDEIGRLEVAVDDALAVCVVDRTADPFERGEQMAAGVTLGRVVVAAHTPGDDVREGDAADGLHREVGGAVGALADVVDRHDRRMLELTLDPRLAEEPRAQLGVSRSVGSQLLARDATTDPRVDLRADDSHAAAAELAVWLVSLGVGGTRRDRVARGGRRAGVRIQHRREPVDLGVHGSTIGERLRYGKARAAAIA